MKKVVPSRLAAVLASGIVLAVLLEFRAVGLIPPAPGSGSAMPITLAWERPEDPNVVGFALYYGLTNQPVAIRVDAGSNTTVTIFGLRAGEGYRLYAVSYNAAGTESVPSNELLVTPPAISRLQLQRQTNGVMQVSGKAAPGTVCTIQFTPTLQPALWRTLRQATADQLGNIVALDADADKVGSRYYRLALGALPLLGEMQVQPQADGTMLLRGLAPPGAECRVEYAFTPDASLWLTLGTVTADAEGNVTVVDATAPQAQQRFYRMALP